MTRSWPVNESRGPGLELGDAIEAAVARLATYPYSGRPGRVAGTRELIVSPFIIAFLISGSQVRVLLRPLFWDVHYKIVPTGFWGRVIARWPPFGVTIAKSRDSR
jgi:ParE toxin of type II toxin-antitoxin system, parDE